MKYLLLFLVSLIASTVNAQTTDTYWVVHAENDLFNPFNENTDKYFTHGTQFSYIKESDTEKEVFSLFQTIYTPSAKTSHADPEVLKNDRPYTGFLGLEYRDTIYKSETLKDTWGISVGCTGRCSYAKESQSTVHHILGQSVPTWDTNYTLKNEPGAILELERNYMIGKSNYADVSTYGALKAGNIIDSGAVGIDSRVGYNLDRFASEPIIFKLPETAPSNYTAYLFVRIEERLVPYNHFLDGSLFRDERHTVHSELSVQEGDLGFTVGYKNYKFTYRYTVFSSEWEEHSGSFGFGGLDFSW